MMSFDYREQTFSYEDDEGNSVTWPIIDIIEHTKDIPLTKLRIDSFKGYLDYAIMQYNRDDWERVRNADTTYPILVGAGTFRFTDDVDKGARYPLIFDGVHRLVKLMRAKETYVDAVVTSTLPTPTITGKGVRLNGMSYSMGV